MKNASNKNRSANTNAYLESYFRNVAYGKVQIKALGSPVYINFHNKRHRLVDPDGASCKYALDGIVEAGLLKNDTAKKIKAVTKTQEKIDKSQSEMTIITILMR